MKFTPISRLPKIVEVDGIFKSEPVLGLSVNGGMGVVQATKDDEGKIEWHTRCSNAFDVTEYLQGWQYLPKPEMKK